MNAPFHLSLPCRSITGTRNFYVEILGASLGRHTSNWIDIDLFGNQITFTKSGEYNFIFTSYKFGDAILPAFHFGVIVGKKTWKALFRSLKNTAYEKTEKYTFLQGKPGEHSSFFIKDPNGHTVEFKCFKKETEIFKQNS